MSLGLVLSSAAPSSCRFYQSSSASSSNLFKSVLRKISRSSSSSNIVNNPSSISTTFKSSTTKFPNLLICRAAPAAAAEYKFPDPIPEFADAETEKFRSHLMKKLPKKDIYGDSVDVIIGICTEIFSTFLHTEYGGPGTLLVVPFIDMADTLNERGLPGGPQAARTAIKWAQDHVDNDWDEWTGEEN